MTGGSPPSRLRERDMKLSRSELHAALEKAGRGAGLDVELARQVARALVWACTHNRPQAIDAFLAGADQSLKAEVEAIAQALDHVVAHPGETVALSPGRSPHLLEALCVAWGENYSCSFTFTSASDHTPLGTAPGATPVQLSTADVTCTRVELAGAVGTPGADPDLDDTTWSRINALAARTYVPSSEASRATGAGAGLNDND